MRASACNGWPSILVCINDHEHLRTSVDRYFATTIEFTAEDINHIQIRLYNKCNGPDLWDTKLDENGYIIEDKYCVIESVMVDGMRCPWLIEESAYQFDDGRTEPLHGWLSQNGCYSWQIPRDVRGWMIENRRRRSAVTGQASSLHYHHNYFNVLDAGQIEPLLEQCRLALNELDASTGH